VAELYVIEGEERISAETDTCRRTDRFPRTKTPGEE
jgi:hypothetical protein